MPKKIENALRKGLQSFAKKAGGGTAVKEKNASLTSNKNNADVFTYDGKQYRLVVAAESKGGTTLKIVEKATGKPVGKPLKEEHFTTAEAKQEFRELLAKAEELRNKAKKPLAGQPRANVAALKPLQADVNKERDDVKSERVMAKCVFLNAGCFAAGTKLWTPQGYRNIEDIRPGERIYSRDQWNEAGEIVAKIVEEVFERYTAVLEVLADGRAIRTTGEHPFCVAKKGWTPANELRVGDKLVCADRVFTMGNSRPGSSRGAAVVLEEPSEPLAALDFPGKPRGEQFLRPAASDHQFTDGGLSSSGTSP